MTHGSLFSGIGGFDLAAEWMGWENIFHCEWNSFGQKVLKHYWPNAISYENICTTDFTVHRGQIDILTGGFPCQPFSLAGARLGKEDERHLWPQMLRTIREVKPSWIVGENVYGLVNWSGGLVFHEVQSDLEAEGYEVFPFLLPACSVNAPHRRDRIWFVAHSNNKRGSTRLAEIQNENGEISEWDNDAKSCDTSIQSFTNSYNKSEQQNSDNRRWKSSESEQNNGHEIWNNIGSVINNWDVTNTKNSGQQTRIDGQGKEQSWRRNSGVGISNYWESFPSVSPICNGDDGLSDRLDNITFPKWRNESIKAGGNAIVPQVAYQIFKTIEEYERIRIAKED